MSGPLPGRSLPRLPVEAVTAVAPAPAEPPIDLAWNENPWGPSPLAVEAARRALAGVHRYPQASLPLKARLAERLGVPERRVLLGAGSSELIDLIVQAFCGPGDEALAPAYAFACYRMSCQGHGCAYREVANAPGFACDVDALAAAVTARTRVVFLANPNNPTGTYVRRPDFERLLDALPAHVLLVVDEAYFEYARAVDYPDAVRSLARRERLIALRTFSKVHGLAGMRVGYAVGAEPLLEALEAVRLPFSVNAIGQAAACAALDDAEHLERSRMANLVERRRLEAALRGMGLAVVPSQANFLLVGLGGVDIAATQATHALLRRGVRVRSMESYGLPLHLRITVGTEADNAYLMTGIRAILGV